MRSAGDGRPAVVRTAVWLLAVAAALFFAVTWLELWRYNAGVQAYEAAVSAEEIVSGSFEGVAGLGHYLGAVFLIGVALMMPGLALLRGAGRRAPLVVLGTILACCPSYTAADVATGTASWDPVAGRLHAMLPGWLPGVTLAVDVAFLACLVTALALLFTPSARPWFAPEAAPPADES